MRHTYKEVELTLVFSTNQENTERPSRNPGGGFLAQRPIEMYGTVPIEGSLAWEPEKHLKAHQPTHIDYHIITLHNVNNAQLANTQHIINAYGHGYYKELYGFHTLPMAVFAFIKPLKGNVAVFLDN